jgi:hypothetical protein
VKGEKSSAKAPTLIIILNKNFSSIL